MKRIVLLASLAFGFTLALLVAQRLSDQAMAVIVGSVIGVAASVPMTALVLWLMLRQRVPAHPPPSPPVSRYEPPIREEPRIMVIQAQPYPTAPVSALTSGMYAPPAYNSGQPRAPREFTIVGEEDLEERDA